MRILKHHEKRLLKKVDFLDWKRDANKREVKILKKFGIDNREEYHKYNKICGLITSLVSQLRQLPEHDEARISMTKNLCKKLAQIGVMDDSCTLSNLEGIPASNFCKRRLSTILLRLHYSSDIDHAKSLIQHGRPDLVTNPAIHITREMEDHLTWAEGSIMKRKIKEFKNENDDYELMN